MNSAEFTGLFILVGIPNWFAMILFTRTIIKRKGYDLNSWCTGAVFFPLVALIAAAGMPIRTKEDKVTYSKDNNY